MRITSEQYRILGCLKCERLSSNPGNLRFIGSFKNYKNESIANTLLNNAYSEDEDGTTAYYLVKDSDGDILFYFSLKCGLLYDEFIEGERLGKLKEMYEMLSDRLSEESLPAEERQEIASILEKTRTKKGVKKAEVARILQATDQEAILDEIFTSEGKTVNKTYPGIEIVHFCANDACRDKWNGLGLKQKLGVVVFWYFLVPIVQKAMEYVGCEYLFLFAADLTPDQELINYYRLYLNFTDENPHTAAIPLYDFTCRFMLQPVTGLADAREDFFENFNHGEDVI